MQNFPYIVNSDKVKLPKKRKEKSDCSECPERSIASEGSPLLTAVLDFCLCFASPCLTYCAPLHPEQITSAALTVCAPPPPPRGPDCRVALPADCRLPPHPFRLSSTSLHRHRLASSSVHRLHLTAGLLRLRFALLTRRAQTSTRPNSSLLLTRHARELSLTAPSPRHARSKAPSRVVDHQRLCPPTSKGVRGFVRASSAGGFSSAAHLPMSRCPRVLSRVLLPGSASARRPGMRLCSSPPAASPAPLGAHLSTELSPCVLAPAHALLPVAETRGLARASAQLPELLRDLRLWLCPCVL
jgi:hypothetical protein